ncbi:MAG: hypothetical protein ACYDAG_03620 [Chloroflexota bacterium]
MLIPSDPDPLELNRLLDTLTALVDLRADGASIHRARTLVVHVQADVVRTLRSPTPHREWRQRRPRVVKTVDELNQLLHQRTVLPPFED